MTRDEHRAKCITAMNAAYFESSWDSTKTLDDNMTDAFDSLHGIARVNPIEATEEMNEVIAEYTGDPLAAFRRIATAGDLTNPPETKP